jgi:hypothetical protein
MATACLQVPPYGRCGAQKRDSQERAMGDSNNPAFVHRNLVITL